MLLTWYGNSCFLLKTDIGKRILFDPFEYGNDLSCIVPNCDFITISHSFFNNELVTSVYPNSKIINTIGMFDLNDITLEGISTFHDNLKGLKRGKNIIYIATIDNLRICHLGHLGHIPQKDILDKLIDIDILLIPIQSTFTLSGTLASKLSSIILPKYIIPMNYSTSDSISSYDFKKFIHSVKNISTPKCSTIDLSKLDYTSNSTAIILKPDIKKDRH